MFKELVAFIRSVFGEGVIPLHRPVFCGNEKKYVIDCIDSTFVSSVGSYVNDLEIKMAEYTGAAAAVAVVNGTAALHVALQMVGVKNDDEVLCPVLTFVATANAIMYLGAKPVFLDSDADNLALSPASLRSFLEENCQVKADGYCYNKQTRKRVKACVPMHVFGHPAKIREILSLCNEYKISVVEDAAESLGSFLDGQHTGTFADIGILSFNGNKIVTSGGGGMLLFRDKAMAAKAKHLTTTAKVPHAWEFFHDEVGFNYRLPNINSALALAQLERIETMVEAKRKVASGYHEFFKRHGYETVREPAGSRSNYWLNAVLVKNKSEKEELLKSLNDSGIQARPLWKLMSDLPAFADCLSTPVPHARSYYERVVNLPSSVV